MTTWWTQNGLTSLYSTTVSMIGYQHLHIAFVVKDIVYEGFRSHPPVVVCWTALQGNQHYDEIYSQICRAAVSGKVLTVSGFLLL